MHAQTQTAPPLGLALAAALLVAPAALAAGGIEDALDRAVAQFLVQRQNPDGGYGPHLRVEGSSDVGITGLVLHALARHPRRYKAVDGPFISRAVRFLLAHQQADGGFYDPRDPFLKNYRTSVAVLALTALDPVEYAEPIRRARELIKKGQLNESVDYSPEEHLSYGGIGYGTGLRADLSNSTFAAEALAAAGLSGSDPLWKQLDHFLASCQNTPEAGPLLKKQGIGTTGDGGFRYAPNTTRGRTVVLDDGTRLFPSYGSMTYQGLRALLYAQVPREDPRVQVAVKWIADHFTVRENPGIATRDHPQAGQQGLFYYYHAMAKALALYGEPVITDSGGRKHRWARELSDHLLRLQREDGSWLNTTGRWWEDIPELDTAYAMIALSACLEELEKLERAEKPGAAAGARGAGKSPEPRKGPAGTPTEEPAPEDSAAKDG